MDPFREKMICQVCPDKRKTVMAIDDTKRITLGLKRLFTFSSVRKAKSTPVMFHDPAKCHYTAGSCSRFRTLSLDLRSAEQELKAVYDALHAHLQLLTESGDEETAGSIGYKAIQLLRGHYPQAVRFLDRGILRR